MAMVRSVINDLSSKLSIDEIQPQGDHILIEVLERNRSKAGIIIPGKEKAECLYGKVLKVGNGECSPETGEYYGPGVKAGDIIMSVQYMGEKIQAIGKNYRLLREHGIWATLKIERKSEFDFEILEIHPYRDHILLKMAKEEKTLKGHLFLPSNPQAMFRMADVVSTGPGERRLATGVVIPPSVKAKDRVIVMRYTGCIMHMKGIEYRLSSEEDIMAIFEGLGDVDCIAGQHALPRASDNYGVMSDAEMNELNRKTIVDSGGEA
jgi:co-chaperonin GroES (HSP10)